MYCSFVSLIFIQHCVLEAALCFGSIHAVFFHFAGVAAVFFVLLVFIQRSFALLAFMQVLQVYVQY